MDSSEMNMGEFPDIYIKKTSLKTAEKGNMSYLAEGGASECPDLPQSVSETPQWCQLKLRAVFQAQFVFESAATLSFFLHPPEH